MDDFAGMDEFAIIVGEVDELMLGRVGVVLHHVDRWC
jgi:hypothetical protein